MLCKRKKQCLLIVLSLLCFVSKSMCVTDKQGPSGQLDRHHYNHEQLPSLYHQQQEQQNSQKLLQQQSNNSQEHQQQQENIHQRPIINQQQRTPLHGQQPRYFQLNLTQALSQQIQDHQQQSVAQQQQQYDNEQSQRNSRQQWKEEMSLLNLISSDERSFVRDSIFSVGLFRECLQSDSLSCLSSKVIGRVNTFLRQRSLKLSDNIELVKINNDDGSDSPLKINKLSPKGEREHILSRTVQMNDRSIKELIWNRLYNFFNARELRIKLPFLKYVPDTYNFKRSLQNDTLIISLRQLLDAAGNTRMSKGMGMGGGGFGGKKGGKGGGGMMMMMMMMKMMMATIGIAAVGALAMKGLGVGMIALVLAAIAAIKTLTHKEDDHGSGHVVYHSGSNHHGYRSLDTDRHDDALDGASIAYRSHAHPKD